MVNEILYLFSIIFSSLSSITFFIFAGLTYSLDLNNILFSLLFFVLGVISFAFHTDVLLKYYNRSDNNER